jgi:hypothetical protein
MTKSALTLSGGILVFLVSYVQAPTVNTQTATATCEGAQAQVRSLRAKITADETAIRGQAHGLTQKDFDNFVNAADEARQRMRTDAWWDFASGLLDGFLAVPNGAAAPRATYSLRNGLGSLNPSRVETIIKQLAGC